MRWDVSSLVVLIAIDSDAVHARFYILYAFLTYKNRGIGSLPPMLRIEEGPAGRQLYIVLRDPPTIL